MYCPKCSQQQINDEMRFCSRCGFPLSAVRDVVASGGTQLTPPTQVVEVPRVPKGVRWGVRTMLASFALAFFILLLSAIEEELLVLLLIPFFTLLVGFLMLLYGTFLETRRQKRKDNALQPGNVAATPAQLGWAPDRPELSAPQVVPVERFNLPRVQTAEMTQPPSVTERTTRLFEEETESGSK